MVYNIRDIKDKNLINLDDVLSLKMDDLKSFYIITYLNLYIKFLRISTYFDLNFLS